MGGVAVERIRFSERGRRRGLEEYEADSLAPGAQRELRRLDIGDG